MDMDEGQITESDEKWIRLEGGSCSAPSVRRSRSAVPACEWGLASPTRRFNWHRFVGGHFHGLRTADSSSSSRGGLRYVKYGFVTAQSKGLLNLLPTFGAW